MGCGSSAPVSEKRKSNEKAKEEPVVAFTADEDDDDDIASITPATGPGSRNPKSAIGYAHTATAEETQAAVERSLTIQDEKNRQNASNEVGAFDEPQPFTVEQSPRNSPRMQKSGSNADRASSPAVLKKYQAAALVDDTPTEKKHYFPDTSPVWEVSDEPQQQPAAGWSTGGSAGGAGGDKPKREGGGGGGGGGLFPSIAVRPTPVPRAAQQEESEQKGAHLPSIYGTDGKPEPVQLAIVALEQKKMREEHEKNMGSLAYIEQYRNKSQSNLTASLGAD